MIVKKHEFETPEPMNPKIQNWEFDDLKDELSLILKSLMTISILN